MTEKQNPDLRSLLGEWVTVRKPGQPGSWYGQFVGLHDEPGLLLSIPGRGGTCLPQTCTVTRAEAPGVTTALPDPLRAQAAVQRARAIPPTPPHTPGTEPADYMYVRGWRDAVQALTYALDDCAACGGSPVVYRNYREDPFCSHCAGCGCGRVPCVRTSPDTPVPADTDTSTTATPPQDRAALLLPAGDTGRCSCGLTSPLLTIDSAGSHWHA